MVEAVTEHSGQWQDYSSPPVYYPPEQTGSALYPHPEPLKQDTVYSLQVPVASGASEGRIKQVVLGILSLLLFVASKSLIRLNPSLGIGLRFGSLLLAVYPASEFFRRMGFVSSGSGNSGSSSAYSRYWRGGAAGAAAISRNDSQRSNFGSGDNADSYNTDDQEYRREPTAHTIYSASGTPGQRAPHSSDFNSGKDQDPLCKRRDKELATQPLEEARF